MRLSRLHPGGLLACRYDLAGRLLDRLLGRLLSVSVDCLPVGFWLVGRTHFDMVILPSEVRCSVDDLDSNQLLIAVVVR